MSVSEPALFPPEVELWRSQINERLKYYSEYDSDCPEHLREAIRYSLLAAGKRIRPTLVLTASQVCGGDLENAMPSACAVEMIHTYSLIHDDLPAMDDDEVRRGRPSCHVQFDEATAILAGDALIPLAFQTIVENTKPVETAVECVAALARAAGGSNLVGGQADDLAAEFTEIDVEFLERIHRRKTGALLTTALELGGITARATALQRECLVNFGKHLGLTFQIVDDLLDLRGEQAKMGKTIGKDVEQGKMTYPAAIGEEQSEILAKETAAAAISALEPLGESAKPLELIAQFVVNRTQ